MDTRSIDLLNLIGMDTPTKKAANTRGGEWHAPCPVCGGTDRLVIQPNHKNGFYWCRQCKSSGDAIEYVKWTRGLDFKTAVEYLGLPLERRTSLRPVQRRPEVNTLNEYEGLNNGSWQDSGRNFCEWAADNLHSPDGAKALGYLQARGISDRVIQEAGLGFNPEDMHDTWGGVDVWLPRGIVIPWWYEGQLWRINVRRSTGEPKYQQIKGGANGLYGAWDIRNQEIVFMVEGEFDALVLRSHVKGITPVATGAMTWARVMRWAALLNTQQLVVLAFDVDENGAGDDAVSWWAKTLTTETLRKPPPAHDVTDAWKAGIDLQAWAEPHTLADPMREPNWELRAQIAREMADPATWGIVPTVEIPQGATVEEIIEAAFNPVMIPDTGRRKLDYATMLDKKKALNPFVNGYKPIYAGE